MAHVIVYVTAASAAEARALGAALVERRLAASVNIVPQIASFYWWDETLEEGEETLLMAKTRAALVAPLTDLVRAKHSYECPCVVAVPIVDGNPAYLAWIDEETADAAVPTGADG